MAINLASVQANVMNYIYDFIICLLTELITVILLDLLFWGA